MQLSRLQCANLYFFSSVLTSLINKEVVHVYGFSSHYLFTTIQSVVIAMASFGIMVATSSKIRIRNVKNWFVLSLFLSGMVLSNVKTLFYFDVSLYTLYKNCSIVLVAFIERVFFARPISKIGYAALAVMVGTSWTADFKASNSLVGYAWMGVNVASSTAYVLYLKVQMDKNSSKIESVFYTNLLTIPVLGTLSAIFERNTEFKTESRAVVALLILLASLTALLTAYASAWTLKCFNSTAYSMLGASNKLCLSAAAIFWFREPKNPVRVVSVFLGISAGFIYSYDTAKQNKN